ncbi:MAG: adenylyl-sulfate kinase, partial [Rhodopirellula sp. JB053]
MSSPSGPGPQATPDLDKRAASDLEKDANISRNIVWHETTVDRNARESNLAQRGTVVWFTGLSGCGKSTIANELDRLLIARGAASTLLDGDNVRHGLCAPPSGLAPEHGDEFAQRFGLGFSPVDREENIPTDAEPARALDRFSRKRHVELVRSLSRVSAVRSTLYIAVQWIVMIGAIVVAAK